MGCLDDMITGWNELVTGIRDFREPHLGLKDSALLNIIPIEYTCTKEPEDAEQYTVLVINTYSLIA